MILNLSKLVDLYVLKCKKMRIFRLTKIPVFYKGMHPKSIPVRRFFPFDNYRRRQFDWQVFKSPLIILIGWKKIAILLLPTVTLNFNNNLFVAHFIKLHWSFLV